jgi:ferredoxin
MITKKVVLRFSPDITNQPVVYRLAKDYGLEFNILKANIDYKQEGMLILELKGKDKNCSDAINYLKSKGVRIQPFSQEILRNESECIDCGVCIPLCPSGSLKMNEKTRVVDFSDAECIACEMCVRACPQKAMEIYY